MKLEKNMRSVEIVFRKNLPVEMKAREAAEGLIDFETKVSEALDKIQMPPQWSKPELEVRLSQEKQRRNDSILWYGMMILCFLGGVWVKPTNVSDFLTFGHFFAMAFVFVLFDIIKFKLSRNPDKED